MIQIVPIADSTIPNIIYFIMNENIQLGLKGFAKH